MARKSILLFLVLTVLFSVHVYARHDDAKERAKNQEYINKGKDLDDRINRLGSVLVDYIDERLSRIGDKDWQDLKIKEKKLHLLILFNRLGTLSPFNLEEFKDPLRREIYRRLANAMGRAIESRDQLLRKIKILYFDIKKLEAFIKNTGQSVIARDQRRQLGLVSAENAVYEVFLSVNRNENTISIGGKIITIETGYIMAFSPNYNIKAPKLMARYSPSKSREVNVNDVRPTGVKAEKLALSRIYYQAPGTGETKEITRGAVVEAGGKIWFELKLPEPGGYLLAYLQDSHGRTYNLFPGTRNALMNGDYRVPFNLDNPFTDVQRTAAENANTANLTANKIMIGGYTFDDLPGTEMFSFFYTDQRNAKLEQILKEAQNIGEDISQVKGILEGASRFNLNAVLDKPTFYYNKLELNFIHK